MPEQLPELPQPGYAPLNGLTVGADGSIAYDFDGHVSARGLDIEASLSQSGEADRMVRWIDGLPGGAVVAELAAWDGGAGQSAGLALSGHDADGSAAITLYSRPNDSDPPAIALHMSEGNGVLPTRVLLDALGRSDFVQCNSAGGVTERLEVRLDAIAFTSFGAIAAGGSASLAISHNFFDFAQWFRVTGGLSGSHAHLAGWSYSSTDGGDVTITIGNPSAVNFPAGGVGFAGLLVAAYSLA